MQKKQEEHKGNWLKKLIEDSGFTSKVFFGFFVISLMFLGGVFCIVKFGCTVKDENQSIQVITITLMIALSSHVIGWLIGFLFGIPRTVNDVSENKNSHNEIKYRINTNLESISDWLTKIIIGVGISQFNNIKNYLMDISNYFSMSMKINNLNPLITTVIIYFSIIGFFSGYFSTRLILSGALIEADNKLQMFVEKRNNNDAENT